MSACPQTTSIVPHHMSLSSSGIRILLMVNKTGIDMGKAVTRFLAVQQGRCMQITRAIVEEAKVMNGKYNING